MITKTLGYNFSDPFFISPAAAPGAVGGYVPKDRENGLIQGANNGGILYIPALYAEMSIEEIGAAKGSLLDHVPLYTHKNRTSNQDALDRAKKAGRKAIAWTVDAPADGPRVSGARFTIPPRTDTTTFTWDFLNELKNMMDLPVILKGITTVADARKAVSTGADAIILLNHGGRHLDGGSLAFPSGTGDPRPGARNLPPDRRHGRLWGPLQRGGVEVLGLGSEKAVGLGCSLMYAIVYGTPGVKRAIEPLKKEVFLDAVNLGVTDLKELDASCASSSMGSLP